MSEDMTYCIRGWDDCRVVRCERHPDNISNKQIPHSYAQFYLTDQCPLVGKRMTNHEKISAITGDDTPAHIEAVEMLLSKIHDDVQSGLYDENCDKYLRGYREMLKWLNTEVDS